MSAAYDDKHFHSFAEFYPVYLAEHTNRTSRELHFVGSTLAILLLAVMLITGHPAWLLAAICAGYGFAWIGHARFEPNQPASRHHPVYAFVGNWVMYWQMLTGQLSF